VCNPAAIFVDAATGKSQSSKQVHQQAKQLGRGLQDLLDWKKGDILAFYLPNSIYIPAATLGALWAGGAVSPCNPAYTALELAHQLLDSGAKAVLTQDNLLKQVQAACAAANIDESNIVLISPDATTPSRHKTWTDILSRGRSSRREQCRVNPKTDLAFLVYSSGTSGRPKGVRLSHYNMTSNLMQLYVVEQYNMTWNGRRTSGDILLPGQGEDKILACLPFFHIYGLTMFVLSPLFIGVTTLVMEKFYFEEWCSIVEIHKVTFAYIVPPIALLLAKHPSVTRYNLKSLRMTGSGGAPLDRDLVAAVYRRTGIRIKQGYGLSETSPGACHLRWEDWRKGAGSVGWLFPNMELKFCAPALSDEGLRGSPEPLATSSTGELYLRGPNVFLGYHNNAAATAECLSSDGWFRTGDVGYVDAEHFVHITDRVKELIKYKGFQVAPAELEANLLEHADVKDCAVIGVYDPVKRTEVPRAYVVHASKQQATTMPADSDKVIKWMRNRLTDYKRLRGGVVFVESIPKSPSGKILRRVLKEMAQKESKPKL
jgi:4-coumarate--CoA ligase